MDFHHILSASPSSSTSSSASHHHQNGAASRSLSTNSNHNHLTTTTTSSAAAAEPDPMHTWWESISKARTRIHLLSPLVDDSLSSLADSDRPARSLLLSPAAYSAVSASLSSPSSGSGDDPLCHWLYDTFLSSDPDLRLVVLSFLPLLTSLYLSRIHSSSSSSLSGFEAVLLAIYASEVKLRGGKSVVVNVPDLDKPSLYHTPKASVVNAKLNGNGGSIGGGNGGNDQLKGGVGVLSYPLESQVAVKSTKRAGIVGVALDCYYKQISQMPSWSKVEFCRFVVDCAGKECSCCFEFDEVRSFSPDRGCGMESRGDEIVGVVEGMGELEIEEGGEDGKRKGVRIPLPWELFQPILRILGHCLMGPLNSEDVKDSASVAVRRMYARASHELNPQGILATRSLVRLDRRSRESAQASALVNASSNANTPSKAKKPEVLLVSK